jgi:hypothetical protein
MDGSLVIVGLVMLVVVVVALISRYMSVGGDRAPPKIAETGSRLLKAASKWSVMAQETKSTLISLMHIEAAKTYVHALRDLMSDSESVSRFRTDPKKMLQSLERREQKLLRKIAAAAPTLIPDGEHIGRTGWIG